MEIGLHQMCHPYQRGWKRRAGRGDGRTKTIGSLKSLAGIQSGPTTIATARVLVRLREIPDFFFFFFYMNVDCGQRVSNNWNDRRRVAKVWRGTIFRSRPFSRLVPAGDWFQSATLGRFVGSDGEEGRGMTPGTAESAASPLYWCIVGAITWLTVSGKCIAYRYAVSGHRGNNAFPPPSLHSTVSSAP